MRRSYAVTVLGIGLGIALGAAIGASPAAAADAIDDAWPYGNPGAPYTLPSDGMTLPGYVGGGSNFEQNNFGPITWSQGDVTYVHTMGGDDDWYSAQENTFLIPSFLSDDHHVVDELLDSSAIFPTVGTVADHFQLFPLTSFPVGGVWLMQSYSLADPDLGSASAFVMPGMANIYLGDDAGIKDIVNFFGQTFTLFEIPFAPASSAATPADLGDGLQQLLTEFTSAFPGPDGLSDLAALF